MENVFITINSGYIFRLCAFCRSLFTVLQPVHLASCVPFALHFFTCVHHAVLPFPTQFNSSQDEAPRMMDVALYRRQFECVRLRIVKDKVIYVAFVSLKKEMLFLIY